MKKAVFLISLFTISFAVLAGITSYQKELTGEQDSADVGSTAYIAKYRDCIGPEDFPSNLVLEETALTGVTSHGSSKLDAEVKKYGKALEEAIKNLNHIEAHNHIHQEFQRSLYKLGQTGLAQHQRLYYLETLRLCYKSDKALNLLSAGNL